MLPHPVSGMGQVKVNQLGFALVLFGDGVSPRLSNDLKLRLSFILHLSFSRPKADRIASTLLCLPASLTVS